MLENMKPETFPMDALNRLAAILHTSELTALIVLLNLAIAKPLPSPIKEGLVNLSIVAQTCVHALQNTLLRVKIKKKSDVYNIAERKDVAKVLEFIKKASGEAHKALLEAGKKAKEITDT